MRQIGILVNIGKIFSLILAVLLACSSQILLVKRDHIVNLKTCSVKVALVDSLYHSQQYSDSEGEFLFWFFSFPGGEEVRFCQGRSFEFMEDALPSKDVRIDSVKSTSWGVYDNGKTWRIDKHEHNVAIYYCQVPIEKKQLFDDMMDSAVIQPLEGDD